MYDTIIIIPYRDRNDQLKKFIEESVPLFEKHLSNFKLLIIEQEKGKIFNRGKLLNVGFKEYLNKTNYFITHDIDIYPMEKTILNYYNKTDADIIGIYTSYYDTLGGIMKINNDAVKKSNGFPNNYWGWGVEDKAIQNRANFYNITISKNLIMNKSDQTNLIDIHEGFTRLNNKNDRAKDENFNKKTQFEYTIFKNLQENDKKKHILSSGLNNLTYTIINRININDNVELIKVSI
jgi:hypothetical protein